MLNFSGSIPGYSLKLCQQETLGKDQKTGREETLLLHLYFLIVLQKQINSSKDHGFSNSAHALPGSSSDSDSSSLVTSPQHSLSSDKTTKPPLPLFSLPWPCRCFLKLFIFGLLYFFFYFCNLPSTYAINMYEILFV